MMRTRDRTGGDLREPNNRARGSIEERTDGGPGVPNTAARTFDSRDDGGGAWDRGGTSRSSIPSGLQPQNG